MLFQVEGDVCKRLDREKRRSDSFLGSAFEDAEIAQSRQQFLCNAEDSRLRPSANRLSLFHPSFYWTLEIMDTDVYQAPLPHGEKYIGDRIVEKSVSASRVKIEQSF